MTQRLAPHAADLAPTSRHAVVSRLLYQSADATNPADVARVLDEVREPVVVYLTLPPAVLDAVVRAVAGLRLPEGSESSWRSRSCCAPERRSREIAIHFEPVPHLVSGREADPAPNVSRLQLDPDRMSVRVTINGAGDLFGLESVELDRDLGASRPVGLRAPDPGHPGGRSDSIHSWR